MEIFNQLNNQKDLVVALGFFDGVHIAHQKVIADCVTYAEKNNLKSAVLTFREHPCVSLWNLTPQYINTKNDRIKKIQDLGVDYLYLLDFSHEFAQQTSEEFLNLIKKTINPTAIFTGYNFFFGKNKSGNPQTLKKLAEKYNFKYFEISEQKIKNLTISSTNIRHNLQKGEIKIANTLLGYDFYFCSQVIAGNQLGRKINFPTANVIYPEELIPLKYGVYSVNVKINNKLYNGLMNYGYKPTISKDNNISCEIHILNFNQNIYSQEIIIYPQKYLREQKKFDSLEELKNQILLDIKFLNKN